MSRPRRTNEYYERIFAYIIGTVLLLLALLIVFSVESSGERVGDPTQNN